jgi:DNA-binding PadR family transcriptional regulator
MLTNAELAILSLIVEQPRHGYDIEQVIEARQMRNWTEIGFSSIYYVLKKLERDGLIVSHLEASSGPGPARRVYSVTAAGKVKWCEAALLALAAPQRAASSLLLAGDLPLLPPGEE